MKTNYFITILLLTFYINSFSQESIWLNKKVDLKNLETRKDSFNMIQDNKVVGYWIWETQKNDNEIVFKDESVLTGVINETFVMKLNKHNLNAFFVDMKMWTATDTLKVDIDSQTNKDINANFNLSGKRSRITKIDTTYSKNIILRPEIFGLFPTIIDFKSLDESIETFFLSSGIVSTMQLKYIGEEKVTVSAGTFETYKISFQGEKQVSNIIYIKKDFPRRIVKVEVISQPLTIELVE
jgi:hypothetical protein